MKETTMLGRTLFLFFFLLAVFMPGTTNPAAVRSAQGGRQTEDTQLPPTYVPTGRQIYKEHCAACHGSDGRGRGPVAISLRTPPPDLTTLTKRHKGTFPEEYVTNVLRFGVQFSTHGSVEMPVWGPIFQNLENYNEAAVRQRIKNLCDFLASIQER
jgi:mono/diheme cytochrome c family protein